MKIAILGPGKVAHALGAGWKKAGHHVVLGARDASALAGIGALKTPFFNLHITH